MDKDFKSTIIIWLIAISIISIITLCRTFYNNVSLEWDIAALLVGILAALCTVLIGWQIFSFMEFSKAEKMNASKIEEINKLIDEIKKEDIYEKYLYYYALSDIYANLAGGKIVRNIEYEYLKNRLEALYYASLFEDWELCRSIVNLVIDFIHRKEISISNIAKKDLINTILSMNSQHFADEFCELLIALREIKT